MKEMLWCQEILVQVVIVLPFVSNRQKQVPLSKIMISLKEKKRYLLETKPE